MRLTVQTIESMIERDLSPSEAQTIEWLSGWEQETQNNILMILLAYGAATYKSAKSEEYEGSNRQMRDRALMAIGALIEDPEKVKNALAVLDGNLEALRN
ncbi:hypothetical protein [Paenibacillus chitinolyticus]|uniref:hypothetical protein n=1 Tax=Paenibacillus chitinolyticus TaxID=79263 RepID=UPI001C45A5C7|nr:hypothetical protein [Paenibacillus chitinolyticus]MBV6717189.1 hypothetical protein [Paenibacillus chitinolyticus]